jgi:P27 family predicted phage terminase small subunit
MRPRPPKHLDAVAVRKFRAVCDILDARGEDLDAGTLDAVAAYASAWSLWIAASQQVAELGPVVRSSTGTAQESPYLAVARKAQVALRQWAAELKLTPKSRKGSYSAKPTTPIDPLDEELRLLMLTEGIRQSAG